MLTAYGVHCAMRAAAGSLTDRGIVDAPDYCVNAGGLIQVADELDPSGFSFDRARQRATGIGETTRRILESAARDGVPTAVAADSDGRGPDA